MCETAERCLSRTDFRWWSTTRLQVEQNRRLLSAWKFPGYCLAHSCGVMLHGFFFGFTFRTNLSIFKAETWERKLFCSQINQSRVPFFFSKLFLPLMACVTWKTRAQAPMASSIHVLYLLEKNLQAPLKVWKKHSLLIDFSKFLKIMRHNTCMRFFLKYVNYAVRAKLCDFASMHNSGNPVIR